METLSARKLTRKGALLLLVTLIGSVISLFMGNLWTAKAASNEPSQAEINQVAEILKTTDESVLYDQNGVMMGIDVAKLTAKYGQQSQFEQMNQILQAEYPQRQQLAQASATDRSVKTANDFVGCMKSQLLDYVGMDAFAALSAGGIQGLIQKKSWQEAAKLILHYIKLGPVQIVAAELALMAIKCA